MAISEKARTAVTTIFAKNPGASPAEFRAAAEKADKSIKGLAPRSFNASYVLPLKRAAAAGAKPAKKKVKAAKKKRIVKKAKPAAKVAKKRGRPAKKIVAKRGPGRPRKNNCL